MLLAPWRIITLIRKMKKEIAASEERWRHVRICCFCCLILSVFLVLFLHLLLCWECSTRFSFRGFWNFSYYLFLARSFLSERHLLECMYLISFPSKYAKFRNAKGKEKRKLTACYLAVIFFSVTC